MHKKNFTRKTPWLFTHLRKQPCPVGYFKTEDDLYHAYVDWLDYYDPIGFVRNWGIHRECELEADYLALRVQYCTSVEAFTAELRRCFAELYFTWADVKPHFLRHGFRAAVEDGWALWRRFAFDMRQNPAWVASQAALAKFRQSEFNGDPMVTAHRLLRGHDVDCLFQWQRTEPPRGLVQFIATEVAGLSNAQLIEKCRATGVIREDAAVHVLGHDAGYVTIAFDWAVPQRPDGAYIPGPFPRRKKRVVTIEVD